MNRRTVNIVVNLVILSTIFFGIIYGSLNFRVIPTVMSEVITETSYVVRESVISVGTNILRTTVSTGYAQDAELVVTYVVAQNQKIISTVLFTEQIVSTRSFETASIKALSELYPNSFDISGRDI